MNISEQIYHIGTLIISEIVEVAMTHFVATRDKNITVSIGRHLLSNRKFALKEPVVTPNST